MTDMTRGWYDVSVSSTGLYQTAVVYGGKIYTSSDYGVNWTERQSNNRDWSSVSISATGEYQTAIAANSSQIYTSTDYGVNWTTRESVRLWRCVSVSEDGLYQSATVQNGQIYTSSTGFNSVFTNYYTYNLDNGSTFFITGTAPTANYTANFTISTLNTSRSYLITLINTTSSTASYYCNSVSINGTAISASNILWTVPTANIPALITGAAKINQEFILYYNTTASAWFVTVNIKKF